MEQNLLFLVIGPAGVGKSTVIQRLLSLQDLPLQDLQRSKHRIRFLPSYTTRNPRTGETKGNPYFFVDQKEFERKIHQEELLEWKLVHGNQYYGIGKKEIESILKSSDHGITDLEVLGAREILETFPNRTISIFLSAQEKELTKRMQARSNRPEEIQKRIHRAKIELLYQNDFDYLIPNENLEHVCQQILEITDFESKFFSKRRARNTFLKVFVACGSEVLLRIQKSLDHAENTEHGGWELFFCRFRSDYPWQDALTREFSLLFLDLSLEECNWFTEGIFLDSATIVANISQASLKHLKKSENFIWQSFPIEKAKQMLSKESDILTLSKMASKMAKTS